jgi:hypothetical protein
LSSPKYQPCSVSFCFGSLWKAQHTVLRLHFIDPERRPALGSRILLPFQRCRLSSAREPNFAPFQLCRPSSAIAMAALAPGSRILPLFSAAVRQAPSQWLRWRQGAEFAPLFNATVRQAPSQWLRWRQGAEFCPFSALPLVKRHRNGRAGAGEPNFAPFSTLPRVKPHRNK